jgi:hypothetical protein
VGPRAGVDTCGKSRPHRDSIPGQSLYRLRYPAHITSITTDYKLLQIVTVLQCSIELVLSGPSHDGHVASYINNECTDIF